MHSHQLADIILGVQSIVCYLGVSLQNRSFRYVLIRACINAHPLYRPLSAFTMKLGQCFHQHLTPWLFRRKMNTRYSQQGAHSLLIVFLNEQNRFHAPSFYSFFLCVCFFFCAHVRSSSNTLACVI